MLAKTAPEGPPGFTNVKNGRASVTGYAVHKITGLAGEMTTDRKRVARASYLGVFADVLASMATGARHRDTRPSLLFFCPWSFHLPVQ